MTSPYLWWHHPNHVFPPLNPIFIPLFPYFHNPLIIARFYYLQFVQFAIYLDTVCLAICRNISRISRIQSRCKARFFEWPFSSPLNQSLNWMLPFRLYFFLLPMIIRISTNHGRSWSFAWGKSSRFSTKFVIFLYSCVLLQILGTHH